MADLTTTYMGLTLANPLIVGSSTHTATPAKAQAVANAGAGALVLKSIFEEQIRVEMAEAYAALADESHPEAAEYLRADIPMQLGPAAYLERLEAIRAAVNIPVIASVNCTTPDTWISFARKIEAVGAAAIELNVYDIPDSPEVTGTALEARHLELIRAVRDQVRIPIAVKLGPFYSSTIGFARQVAAAKVGALVLFNRFFQPDIDVERLKVVSSLNLSRPEDIRLPLRWIAILRDLVDCDLCLSTGVHGHEGAIKALLAGANAFQICSILYKKEPSAIGEILGGLRGWMNRQGFASLADFRGRLSQRGAAAEGGFERTQYVKALGTLE